MRVISLCEQKIVVGGETPVAEVAVVGRKLPPPMDPHVVHVILSAWSRLLQTVEMIVTAVSLEDKVNPEEKNKVSKNDDPAGPRSGDTQCASGQNLEISNGTISCYYPGTRQN